MKSIINGKLYNTETADRIGGTSQGHDFYNVTEILYRKKNGEFFLHAEGGPATIYGKIDESGNRCFGEKLIPYSVTEAKEWSEENLDVDTFIRIFGPVEE